jgi:hypothetical protein
MIIGRKINFEAQSQKEYKPAEVKNSGKDSRNSRSAVEEQLQMS